MFCPNCGSQLQDGTRFCGICGTPISQGTETPKGPGFFKKHLIKIIIGAGAVVAATALILLIPLGKSLLNGGYTAPIKNLITFLNKRSINTEAYFDSGIWGKAAGEYEMLYSRILSDSNDAYSDSFEEQIADHIDELYDEIDEQYGYDWDVFYDIKNAVKLRDSQLDDLMDSWDSYIIDCEENLEDLEYEEDVSEKDLAKLEKAVHKLNKKQITKGYKIKGKLIIEGDEDTDKESVILYVIKIDGDWVLYGGFSAFSGLGL